MLTFACVLFFQTLALGVASPYYEGAPRPIPRARIQHNKPELPQCYYVYDATSDSFSKQCGPLLFIDGSPVIERMTTYQQWQSQYPLETPMNQPDLPYLTMRPSKFIGRNEELPVMDEKTTVISPPRQVSFGTHPLEYPMIFSGIPFGMYPVKFARSEWHPFMGERMNPYSQPLQNPRETPMNPQHHFQFGAYPSNFDRDEELIGYERQTASRPIPSKTPLVPATPGSPETAVPVENPTNLLSTLATRLTKVVSNKFDPPNTGRIDSTYVQDEYPYPSDTTLDDYASQARFSEARGSYGHHGHFGHHSGGFGHHGGSHHYSHHSYGYGGHHEGHHGGYHHYKSADSAEDTMPITDMQRSMHYDNSFPQQPFTPQQNFMSDAMGFRQIPEMESSITEDLDFDSDGPKRVSYHVRIPVEDNVLDPKLKLFPIYNIRCRLEPAKPSPVDIPSDDSAGVPATPSLPVSPTPGNAPPPAPISVPESDLEPPPPAATKPVPAPAPILVPAPVPPPPPAQVPAPAPAPVPAPEAAEQAPRTYFKRDSESKRKVSPNEFLDRLSAINAKLKQIKD